MSAGWVRSSGERTGENAGDEVVVVGLGDLGAIELAGLETFKVAEVVDVDFAVNFWSVEFGAALPQHGRLFALAFGQNNKFATDPLLLGALRYFLLQLHELALAGLDGAFWELGVEIVGFRTFFIGIVEDAEPVEFCIADELLQDFIVGGRLAWEANDEGCAEGNAGNCSANLLNCLEKDVGAGSALHALEHVRRRVLQRNVEILADVVVLRDGFEELAGDAVGVGVEKAHPAKAFNPGQCFE